MVITFVKSSTLQNRLGSWGLHSLINLCSKHLSSNVGFLLPAHAQNMTYGVWPEWSDSENLILGGPLNRSLLGSDIILEFWVGSNSTLQNRTIVLCAPCKKSSDIILVFLSTFFQKNLLLDDNLRTQLLVFVGHSYFIHICYPFYLSPYAPLTPTYIQLHCLIVSLTLQQAEAKILKGPHEDLENYLEAIAKLRSNIQFFGSKSSFKNSDGVVSHASSLLTKAISKLQDEFNQLLLSYRFVFCA